MTLGGNSPPNIGALAGSIRRGHCALTFLPSTFCTGRGHTLSVGFSFLETYPNIGEGDFLWQLTNWKGCLGIQNLLAARRHRVSCYCYLVSLWGSMARRLRVPDLFMISAYVANGELMKTLPSDIEFNALWDIPVFRSLGCITGSSWQEIPFCRQPLWGLVSL